MEVAKAVGLALEDFHFGVEALGDSVVSGEAPHGGDFVLPGVERVRPRFEARRALSVPPLEVLPQSFASSHSSQSATYFRNYRPANSTGQRRVSFPVPRTRSDSHRRIPDGNASGQGVHFSALRFPAGT